MIIECSSLAAQWKELSGYLGLSFKLIDRIKCDYQNSTCCWNEALKEWIEQNYNTQRFDVPSWRSLLKAIAKVNKLQFKKLATEHQGEKCNDFCTII